MKVLVISDTHGKIDYAKMILDQTIPKGVGAVLHCGDYVTDARLLQKAYPNIEVYSVNGNCDVGFGSTYSEVVTIENVDIFMTHGHRYSVKWGEYDDFIIDTIAHGAQIGVCGHSHCAYLDRSDEVIILNPGSITSPRDGYKPSYAILELKDGKIEDVSIMQILGNNSVTRHPAHHKSRYR